MKRRLFNRLLASAALGTLCSFVISPIRQSFARDGITIYKGWIIKTSDLER